MHGFFIRIQVIDDCHSFGGRRHLDTNTYHASVPLKCYKKSNSTALTHNLQLKPDVSATLFSIIMTEQDDPNIVMEAVIP